MRGAAVVTRACAASPHLVERLVRARLVLLLLLKPIAAAGRSHRPRWRAADGTGAQLVLRWQLEEWDRLVQTIYGNSSACE
ncbi:MAG: hypothetical protein J3K34DRAFT_287918 [Monoraphidium minutum]|nr:MAG: hypothetical protein J3K34DRAFT_287918 [Monoraphidium minutum]